MGTSTRNSGQSGHTPLIPSWLEGNTPFGQETSEQPNTTKSATIPPNADSKRFTGPRTDFTQYITGSGRDSGVLRRAISHYVTRSLGGSSNATTRLGSSRGSTARLYGVLHTLSRGGGVREVGRLLSIDNLEGLSTGEFFISVARFVCPDGGPNDEGLARSAYYDIFTDNPSLSEKPIASLTVNDVDAILQSYMSKVIMEHILNDIGNKTIFLPNDIDSISHIEEQTEQLVSQSVSDACAEIRQSSVGLTSTQAQDITDRIYQYAYAVLEGIGE